MTRQGSRHGGISATAETMKPATAGFERRGGRSYFGGASHASADFTVFFEIFKVRAITLIGRPSARCKRRISAQSSQPSRHHGSAAESRK